MSATIEESRSNNQPDVELSNIALAEVNAGKIAKALLAARAPDMTICPSEVVRALAVAAHGATAEDWRTFMPAVHAAVDSLVVEKAVRLSWKGQALPKRIGPYRIGHGIPDDPQQSNAAANPS